MLKNRLLPDSPTQAALKSTNHVPNSKFPKSSAFQPEFISAKGPIARPGTNQNDASRILAELPDQSSSQNRHHDQATTRISTEHQKKRSSLASRNPSNARNGRERKRSTASVRIAIRETEDPQPRAELIGTSGKGPMITEKGSSREFYLAALGSCPLGPRGEATREMCGS
ncbi:hypothetical protein NL676_016909 [Syzygium grande]|nr:hypothetical protein NL676_016909 [Syzygium grande]